MRVANKLTPEPKSKMAEIMSEYTGREQELKRCLSPPMRVANKLTPEPKCKMAETSQLSDYSSQFLTTLAAVTNYSTAHVHVLAS